MEFSDNNYNARLEQLFVKFPSVQKQGFTPGAYKSGLDGMLSLDAALGHPHRSYRTIHVAGTNGKGSVSSMLAASLAAKGLKVGLYTSPHLKDFRERIKIISCNGWLMIPRRDVWDFLDQSDSAMQDNSFFEITTAMAFWWFEKSGVDMAVIETGLGGRLDSTNIITPEACVVTSIGLDHCAMLGNTRELIAAEKAGIFKPGVPAIVWGSDSQTDPIFEQTAAEKGSPLIYADKAAIPQGINTNLLDLKGDYQEVNVRTACAALRAIGIEPDAGAIMNCSKLTGLQGRWQILSDNPLTICDIGHNPAALEWNFKQLGRICGGGRRDLTMVYGVMADKDVDTIISMLPEYARFILCAPHTSRALPEEDLYARIKALRPELRCQTAPSVEAATQRARETAGPESVIYIGGSAFVVAEAL